MIKVKELKFHYQGDVIRIPVERIWGFSVKNTVSRLDSVKGLSYLTLRLDSPPEDKEVCCSMQTCWQPTLDFLLKLKEERESDE
jgi:hypothetical protein